MTESHLDPAVRAAVFATATREEAIAVMHGPHYKPWTDAASLMLAESFDRATGRDPGAHRSITHGMRGLVDIDMSTLQGPTPDTAASPSA